MRQVGGAPSLRAQQRAFTRRRLVEAGRQVFTGRGYADATVDDVARAAGASRATFYLHFKSKCELACAMIDGRAPVAIASYHELDDLLEAGGPEVTARLRRWLAGWLDAWTNHADANHAMLQAAMLEPQVEEHHLRLSLAMIAALERRTARLPAAARCGAASRALILEIMTQRIFALASMSQLELDDGRLLDILTGMWTDVLVTGWEAGPAASAAPVAKRRSGRAG